MNQTPNFVAFGKNFIVQADNVAEINDKAISASKRLGITVHVAPPFSDATGFFDNGVYNSLVKSKKKKVKKTA